MAALVVICSDVDPEPTTDVGVNVADAPDGRPVTEKSTVPVNPEDGVTVAVYVALSPGITACEAGVAERLKFETVIVRVAG